jgi:hypothetical protein
MISHRTGSLNASMDGADEEGDAELQGQHDIRESDKSVSPDSECIAKTAFTASVFLLVI